MISVTSIDYPTKIAPLTLEIDITVKNPCLDTNYIDTNKKAVTCDVIPADGQIEELDDVQYAVHSGIKDVTLPVIDHMMARR